MPTTGRLLARIAELEREQAAFQRLASINTTLVKVANAIRTTSDLLELFESIHHALSTVIDTTNFYIALYDRQSDGVSFPYCVDVVDDHYPTVLNVSKTSSLTAEVIQTGKPLLISKEEMCARRARSVFMAPACTVSETWLGVPLSIQDNIIGVMTVQSYDDPQKFGREDVDLLTSVAGQVAAAIEIKRTEEALRQSEERYSTVVKQASEGIYLLDPISKKILEANNSFLKMIGRGPESIANLYVYDFVAHNKAEVDRIINQASTLQNQSSPSYSVGERRYIRRDGSLFYVEASASLITYGKQAVLCVIVRDITERKRTETALRESEQKYRRLIEHATDAIYLANADGAIISANRAACRVLGYSKAEFSRLTIEDLDARTTNEQFRAFHADRSPETSSLFESMHRKKDGSLLPVEINSVSYRQQGEYYVLGVARDISDRMRSEQKLLDSAQRINAFFSSVNDAIFVHPLRQRGFARIIEVNDIACERYGYSREEFLSMTVEDITVRPGASEHGTTVYRKKLLKERQLVFETVHIRKNGTEFPVEINSNIIEQHDKPVILAVVRDISERKQARRERELLENKLQQSQKMESIGRLAGGVAHDFNNMLSVILGYTEMALNEAAADTQLSEKLTHIKDAAEHSAELTGQLLAFARKQTVVPQVIDINRTIGDMYEMLRRLIGEDINLAWLPAKNLWSAKIDPQQINQILVNLCVNARDAITSAGTITISTENVSLPSAGLSAGSAHRSGNFIRIQVADNGHGIDREHLDQIFEPFFSTKELGKGTGLGLATVYGIIKQNQGIIEVRSTPEKRETIFSLYLPCYRRLPTQISGEKKELIAPRPDTHSILIVEDEPTIRVMTTAMLQNCGYTVFSAATPEEAINVMNSGHHKIDLLLTDVIMPEMNGRDLANQLLALNPDLKCLFMSGYPADIIAEKGAIEEGVHFLQKPFTIEELSGTINHLLEPVISKPE